jgi:hypothetical protein
MEDNAELSKFKGTIITELVQSHIDDSMQDSDYLRMRADSAKILSDLVQVLPDNDKAKKALDDLLSQQELMNNYLLFKVYKSALEDFRSLPETVDSIRHIQPETTVLDLDTAYMSMIIYNDNK